MESSNDQFLAALRAAREKACEVLDVPRHHCYDKAFLQLTTDLLAQSDIILAHSQDEMMRTTIRECQPTLEDMRSDYPAYVGFSDILMFGAEETCGANPPPECAAVLAYYTKSLQTLRVFKNGFYMCLWQVALKLALEELVQYEQDQAALRSEFETIKAETKATKELRQVELVGQLSNNKNPVQKRTKEMEERTVRIGKVRPLLHQPGALIQFMLY